MLRSSTSTSTTTPEGPASWSGGRTALHRDTGDIAKDPHRRSIVRKRSTSSAARCAGEQRCVPEPGGTPGGPHAATVATYFRGQHRGELLPHPGGSGTHARRLGDHQHRFCHGSARPRDPVGPRGHKGCDHLLDVFVGTSAGGPAHPRERCGAGSGLDAVDPSDHGQGQGEGLRHRHPDGSCRPARRDRPSFVFASNRLSSYYTGEVLAPIGGYTLPG